MAGKHRSSDEEEMPRKARLLPALFFWIGSDLPVTALQAMMPAAKAKGAKAKSMKLKVKKKTKPKKNERPIQQQAWNAHFQTNEGLSVAKLRSCLRGF